MGTSDIGLLFLAIALVTFCIQMLVMSKVSIKIFFFMANSEILTEYKLFFLFLAR